MSGSDFDGPPGLASGRDEDRDRVRPCVQLLECEPAVDLGQGAGGEGARDTLKADGRVGGRVDPAVQLEQFRGHKEQKQRRRHPTYSIVPATVRKALLYRPTAGRRPYTRRP